MNFDELFRGAKATVGLIGAGQFGAALIGQASRIPGLDVQMVCDIDVNHARAVCEAGGFSQVTVAESPEDVRRAIGGGIVVVADASLLCTSSVDIVVEATGQAEAAAVNALMALKARKHVAMVTKETESVVGSELHAIAAEQQRVYTTVDGDQPALLIGLITWANTLGLDIVCAGKSSEYDFVYDTDAAMVTCLDREVAVNGFQWQLDLNNVSTSLAERSAALAAIPQRTVPDLTEMGIVANATGMRPDIPEFHVPLARTLEVPNVFRPKSAGGVLAADGVIDVFNCVRRPDEASFAGGVFVVVRCHDRDTWKVLADKGHPTSACGGYAMMYNPQHLLGLEAATTLMSIAALGNPSGSRQSRPVCDVVARAGRDFRVGEILTIDNAHHHEVSGLDPLLIDAAPLADATPVPYYLAVERPLVRDLRAGEMLTLGHIEADVSSTLMSLRADQDRRFFG